MSDIIDEIVPSNAKKRLSAFVIDDIVISLFFLFIFYSQMSEILNGITTVDEESVALISQFFSENLYIILGVKVAYHTVLIWQNGATVGKHFVGIKVIDTLSGNRPSLPQSALRASLRLVSDAVFYLGFLLFFFTPLKQTLHDKLTNCVVVDG